MLYVLSIWDKSIEKKQTKPEQLCKTVPRATARHSQIWQILLAKYYKQTGGIIKQKNLQNTD